MRDKTKVHHFCSFWTTCHGQCQNSKFLAYFLFLFPQLRTMSVLTLLDSTTLLLGGVLVLSLLWWLSTRRPAGLPPGPGFALPLLGHLHLLDKDPRTQFRAWRRQYGDVFSLYMGGRLVVVLNGFPVIKEALVKFGDVFSDRPRVFTRLCGTNGNE